MDGDVATVDDVDPRRGRLPVSRPRRGWRHPRRQPRRGGRPVARDAAAGRALPYWVLPPPLKASMLLLRRRRPPLPVPAAGFFTSSWCNATAPPPPPGGLGRSGAARIQGRRARWPRRVERAASVGAASGAGWWPTAAPCTAATSALYCSVVYLLYRHWWKNQGMIVWLHGLKSWLWCSWTLVYYGTRWDIASVNIEFNIYWWVTDHTTFWFIFSFTHFICSLTNLFLQIILLWY